MLEQHPQSAQTKPGTVRGLSSILMQEIRTLEYQVSEEEIVRDRNQSNEWVSLMIAITFLELQTKKTHRYVIFKIDEKRKEVIVDKAGGTTERFDDFMTTLPENDC